MTIKLNATHDPKLRSWVASANEAGCDFPIQNLPFGRFGTASDASPRIGVAIGDRILDLRKAGLIDTDDMNALMAATPERRSALRALISQGLAQGSLQQSAWESALLEQSAVTMHVPCRIGDYTDFYTSVHHATTVGKQFRPDNPLLPNYKWVPIGYHGRASSIGVSGQQFRRPVGQTRAPGAAVPAFGPCKRLDYEMEVGIFIGGGNALGDTIAIDQAEQAVFGLCLLNDWSARDLQAWEYQPLGPFLAKNFASTISPWVVTLEALAPYRAPWQRDDADPQPLPYLDAPGLRTSCAFDVQLEVSIQTAAMRAADTPAERVSLSNFRHSYWTVSQLVTHHTVNGCNLQPGDLLGSGTQSGPNAEEAGSLLELTGGGKQTITVGGETRTFLDDGDSVIMRGWAEAAGRPRIGFGEVSGTVLPARVLEG